MYYADIVSEPAILKSRLQGPGTRGKKDRHSSDSTMRHFGTRSQKNVVAVKIRKLNINQQLTIFVLYMRSIKSHRLRVSFFARRSSFPRRVFRQTPAHRSACQRGHPVFRSVFPSFRQPGMDGPDRHQHRRLALGADMGSRCDNNAAKLC